MMRFLGHTATRQVNAVRTWLDKHEDKNTCNDPLSSGPTCRIKDTHAGGLFTSEDEPDTLLSALLGAPYYAPKRAGTVSNMSVSV